MSFDRFENQLIIEGQIVLETPIHIGAGTNDFYGVDNGVVKTVDQKPYIPGSSLKGVIRSFIERIANSGLLDHGDYVEPCMYGVDKLNSEGIIQKTMCLDEYNSKAARDKLREKYKTENEFNLFLSSQSCPICHLFGNQLRAAKVHILDAFVKDWTNDYDIRQGVGIVRDTGIAKNNALYDFEVVPAGTTFQMKIVAENLSDLELKWLLLGLEAFRQGKIFLGGKVARGLGSVSGKDWKVTYLTSENYIDYLIGNYSPSEDFKEFMISRL